MRSKGEALVVGSFALSILAALGLAIVYSTGGQAQWEGILLALALGGIGVGIVVWAQCFLPADEAVEDRPQLSSSEDDVAAFNASLAGGEEFLPRRSLLVKIGLGALGALGLAALFPIRSLGPRAGRGLATTAFGAGLRVVTEAGDPVRPGDLVEGEVLTVWPEGHVGDADAPALLVNTGGEGFVPRAGREDWTVEGIVCYSKLCTHTGCPVGLYQQEEKLLLCPCHQSTFDVLDGARPVFGPATRSLPQLPLGVDNAGYMTARGDFSDPVAGGYWDRGR